MKTRATVFCIFSAALLYYAAIGATPIVEPAGILDDILTDAILNIIHNLTNLTDPELRFDVDRPGLNLSFSAINLLVENLNNIEIANLETTLIPIRVKNISLTLDNAKIISDEYDLDAIVVSSSLQGPVRIFGHGRAEVDLENIFLTASIDFTSVNGSLQIKKGGIKGFDIALGKSKFELENILGDAELGEVVNVFLSYFLPYAVEDFGKVIFAACEDKLIEILNEALKNLPFP